VATAIGPDCKQQNVGIRPGEKIHEEMITDSDSFNTIDLGKYYAILPTSGSISLDDYCHKHNASRVPVGFSYNSGSNPDFLSVEQLRQLIDSNLDH
jgi:FlaA1/EpsC-like NDP-sugar epimerase